MPASLTTSTVAPPLDLVDQRGHPRRLVLVEEADDPARYPDVERLRQRPDSPGVLGGDHVGAAQPLDQARGSVGGLAQAAWPPAAVDRDVIPHSLRSLA